VNFLSGNQRPGRVFKYEVICRPRPRHVRQRANVLRNSMRLTNGVLLRRGRAALGCEHSEILKTRHDLSFLTSLDSLLNVHFWSLSGVARVRVAREFKIMFADRPARKFAGRAGNQMRGRSATVSFDSGFPCKVMMACINASGRGGQAGIDTSRGYTGQCPETL